MRLTAGLLAYDAVANDKIGGLGVELFRGMVE